MLKRVYNRSSTSKPMFGFQTFITIHLICIINEKNQLSLFNKFNFKYLIVPIQVIIDAYRQ